MGSPPRRYQSSTLAASSPARSRRSTAGVESVFPSVLRELASITWVPVCPATVAVTLNTRRGTYGGSTSPWEATGNPAVKRYTSCASSNDPSTASAICQVPPSSLKSTPRMRPIVTSFLGPWGFRFERGTTVAFPRYVTRVSFVGFGLCAESVVSGGTSKMSSTPPPSASTQPTWQRVLALTPRVFRFMMPEAPLLSGQFRYPEYSTGLESFSSVA